MSNKNVTAVVIAVTAIAVIGYIFVSAQQDTNNNTKGGAASEDDKKNHDEETRIDSVSTTTKSDESTINKSPAKIGTQEELAEKSASPTVEVKELSQKVAVHDGKTESSSKATEKSEDAIQSKKSTTDADIDPPTTALNNNGVVGDSSVADNGNVTTNVQVVTDENLRPNVEKESNKEVKEEVMSPADGDSTPTEKSSSSSTPKSTPTKTTKPKTNDNGSSSPTTVRSPPVVKDNLTGGTATMTETEGSPDVAAILKAKQAASSKKKKNPSKKKSSGAAAAAVKELQSAQSSSAGKKKKKKRKN